jgi:hypothetical protein
MRQRLRSLLAHPRFPLVVALVAALLTCVSLRSGFALDDDGHRLRVMRRDILPGRFDGPWDLYRFESGELVQWQYLVVNGIEPWWTAPTLKLAFFRPLASLWLWADHAWLHAPVAWMHAENVIAYALAVFAAAKLYRRVLGAGAVAGLASLLFAIDDAHGMPVGWIAHRHSMMTLALGCAAIAAHDRWRRDAWRAGAWLAPALFAAALGCGEAALAILGYLAAYALFFERGPAGARARSLAAYAVVLAAWGIAYKALDYGSSSSGFYVDPTHEPAAFTRALVERAPVLGLAQLALPPSDFIVNVPASSVPAVAAIAAVVVIALGAALARGTRGEPSARFWAAGALASIVPVCATLPNDRNLFFPGIGAMALVAIFLSRAAGEGASLAWRVARGALNGLFVLLHLVVAPLLLPLRTLAVPVLYSGMVARAEASMPLSLDHETVVVATPDPLVPFYVLARGAVRGGVEVPRLHMLAVDTRGALALTRTGARSVEVELEDGFLHDSNSTLFRDAAHPMRAGDRVETRGLLATVLTVTPDARPKRVRFVSDRDLDDASWVTWEGTRFVPYAAPRAGETRTSPPIDLNAALFGR